MNLSEHHIAMEFIIPFSIIMRMHLILKFQQPDSTLLKDVLGGIK